MPGVPLLVAARRFGDSVARPLVLLDVGVAVVLVGGLLLADADHNVAQAEGAVAVLRTTGSVLVGVTVAFRRWAPRWTLALAALGAALVAGLGGAPLVSVGVALSAYTVAATGAHRSWWALPTVAGAAMAIGVSIGRLQPSWLLAAIASVAVVAVGWFAGLVARERQARIAALAEQRAERERQHTAELRQAAVDERLVIARELHDIVAHSMSVIAIRAGVARMVMDTDPAEVRETLGIIETTTRQALHEMRLLVEVLRHEPAVHASLAPAPGLADIATLVEQIRRAGVDVHVAVEGPARPLPAGVDLSAYRIAQEALTNVVRHAGPTRADLRIEYRGEDLLIDVTDAGPAEHGHRPHAEPRAAAGHGLIGMSERVALFDGQLDTGRHGDGFRVHARLRTDEPAE